MLMKLWWGGGGLVGVGPILGFPFREAFCLGLAGSGVNWGLHHLEGNPHRRG